MAETPFDVTESGGGWGFALTDGRKSRTYGSHQAAEAAARYRKEQHELTRAAERLAKAYRLGPRIPVTLLRVGIAALGPERLDHFLAGAAQARAIQRAKLLTALGCADAAAAPAVYQRFSSLFDDLVTISKDSLPPMGHRFAPMK